MGGAEGTTGPRCGGTGPRLGLYRRAAASRLQRNDSTCYTPAHSTQTFDLLHTGILYPNLQPVTRRHTLCLPCQSRLAALGHALSKPLFGGAVRFRQAWETLGHLRAQGHMRAAGSTDPQVASPAPRVFFLASRSPIRLGSMRAPVSVFACRLSPGGAFGKGICHDTC